jgi:hypothetical protein
MFSRRCCRFVSQNVSFNFFDWKARRDGGTSKKSCEIGAKAPIEPTVSVRGILDNVALEPECRTK